MQVDFWLLKKSALYKGIYYLHSLKGQVYLKYYLHFKTWVSIHCVAMCVPEERRTLSYRI